MEPEKVGWRGDAIVLGKLSGRAGVRARLKDLGFEINDNQLNDLFIKFKSLADNKKEVTDRDLESLMLDQSRTSDEKSYLTLNNLEVKCGNKSKPQAKIQVTNLEGGILESNSDGTGPVDAVFKAIDKLVSVDVKLTEFSVSSVTEGIDALGEVTIKVADSNNNTFSGIGSDPDIVVASAKAYINAINRLIQTGEGSLPSG